MAIERITTEHFTWAHIEKPDASDMAFLKSSFRFHTLNIQDTVGLTELPKVDMYRHYLFVVFHFPYYNEETGRVAVRELNVFVTRDHFITVPEQPIQSLRRFFERYTRKSPQNQQAPYKNTTGYLLYKVVGRLFSEVNPIIEHISRDITMLEKQIFDEETHEGMVQDIATLRRNVLALRRVLDPQRALIRTIAMVRRPFLPSELELYFDDVRDSLDRMWQILGGFLEYLEGLNQSYESLISHRTNKVVRTLTIISVSLLPPTLLASMYGMNIGLPFSTHPNAFWIIACAMLLFEIILFSFFRNKRWL